MYWSKDLALIDPDLKDYLEPSFEALRGLITSLSGKMDILLSSIKEDVDRHREDLDDLYNKDRESKERIQKLESNLENHVDNHKEQKSDKNNNTGVIIGVLGVMIGLAAVIVALLVG